MFCTALRGLASFLAGLPSTGRGLGGVAGALGGLAGLVQGDVAFGAGGQGEGGVEAAGEPVESLSTARAGRCGGRSGAGQQRRVGEEASRAPRSAQMARAVERGEGGAPGSGAPGDAVRPAGRDRAEHQGGGQRPDVGVEALGEHVAVAVDAEFTREPFSSSPRGSVTVRSRTLAYDLNALRRRRVVTLIRWTASGSSRRTAGSRATRASRWARRCASTRAPAVSSAGRAARPGPPGLRVRARRRRGRLAQGAGHLGGAGGGLDTRLGSSAPMWSRRRRPGRRRRVRPRSRSRRWRSSPGAALRRVRCRRRSRRAGRRPQPAGGVRRARSAGVRRGRACPRVRGSAPGRRAQAARRR